MKNHKGRMEPRVQMGQSMMGEEKPISKEDEKATAASHLKPEPLEVPRLGGRGGGGEGRDDRLEAKDGAKA